MQEHQTPEERLLKLIRHKERHPLKGEVATKAKDTASPVKGNLVESKDEKKIFRLVERVLLGLAVVLVVAILYEFLLTGHNAATLLKEPQTKEKDVIADEFASLEPKPSTYYTAAMKERDIFASPLAGKKSDHITTTSIPELAKRLRLVGIVLDNTSEAIIEDVETNQTFFLHKGERIKDAIVDDILESKVILLYGNQKVELVQ